MSQQIEVEVHQPTFVDWLIHQVWFIPAATILYLMLIYVFGWLGMLPSKLVNDIFVYVRAAFPF